jgi:membrane-associated phospholipid phosphatase
MSGSGGTARAGRTRSCALVSLAFLGTYWLVNHLTSVRRDIGRGVFDWERAIPFVAWTIVPYVSICVFFAVSFFVGRNREELDRHVVRLLLALAVSVVCYAAFPLRFTFDRPATTGAIGLLFDALSAFDLPYNRAPSLHISVLLILWVRIAPRLTGCWRAALHAWFAFIAVSVLTTYQHHVIDVPAGLAVGALCIALTARSGGRASLRLLTSTTRRGTRP